MKKIYSKPEMFFESFTLNEHIAAGCEAKIDTPSRSQCGLDYGPFVVFLETSTGCTGDGKVKDMGGDGEYNGLCYHVFSNNGANNLFNS